MNPELKARFEKILEQSYFKSIIQDTEFYLELGREAYEKLNKLHIEENLLNELLNIQHE